MSEAVYASSRMQPPGPPPAASKAAPAPTGAPATEREWQVRQAGHGDVQAVAVAVGELLVELGGTPPAPAAMELATATLIDSPWAGVVLVAEAPQGLVGVLGASWQMAIHVPGSYALIQDLWVDPAWRSRKVGGGLVGALFAIARGKYFERVEVGLPRESFERFGATEAFYLGNGFVANGPRMRRRL
jgi:GNAT superfamily N-acetyltransferase